MNPTVTFVKDPFPFPACSIEEVPTTAEDRSGEVTRKLPGAVYNYNPTRFYFFFCSAVVSEGCYVPPVLSLL